MCWRNVLGLRDCAGLGLRNVSGNLNFTPCGYLGYFKMKFIEEYKSDCYIFFALIDGNWKHYFAIETKCGVYIEGLVIKGDAACEGFSADNFNGDVLRFLRSLKIVFKHANFDGILCKDSFWRVFAGEVKKNSFGFALCVPVKRDIENCYIEVAQIRYVYSAIGETSVAPDGYEFKQNGNAKLNLLILNALNFPKNYEERTNAKKYKAYRIYDKIESFFRGVFKRTKPLDKQKQYAECKKDAAGP